ncbi:MAG: oxidoreductase [Chryseobacterium sp.]|nr:MAG: oxidoreductase [Chryseobacterium sp.]
MHQPIQTGLLSFGTSGKIFHAPFLTTHNGFNLKAIVERSEKKAHLHFPDIISYNSVVEIMSDPELELIVINTPNYLRFEHAMLALQSEKHVLMEKPFALTAREAKLLFEEAAKFDRKILPYQNRRYDSDFLSVQQVLNSGQIGQPVEVHIRFDRYRNTIGPKLAKESKLPGSGLLWDLAPHLLDMAISLFGEPISWTKSLGYYRPNTQVDDYATIHLKFPNQLNVFLTMSMLVAHIQPAFILNGTLGSFVKHRNNLQEEQLLSGLSPHSEDFGQERSESAGVLTLVTGQGKTQQTKIHGAKSTYLSLFDAIYQTIRNQITFPITEQQILTQISILEY